MTKKEKLAQEARENLLAKIKPSSRLDIVIKSVSRSGMCRRMKVYIGMFNITPYVANLCDLSMNEYGELKITGCGMDMTFWLADNITTSLWQGKMPKGLKGNGGNCLDWRVL